MAASRSKAKALEGSWPGAPLLEFKLPAHAQGTNSCCAPLSAVSHFPDDDEWLIRAYTPVKKIGERMQMLAAGGSHEGEPVETLVVMRIGWAMMMIW